MVKREDCVKTLIKVEENYVEARYHLFDKDGKEVAIPALTESFGQRIIDRKLLEAQKEKTRWENMGQIEIDKRKVIAQEEIDYLDLVQIEIDKKLR